MLNGGPEVFRLREEFTGVQSSNLTCRRNENGVPGPARYWSWLVCLIAGVGCLGSWHLLEVGQAWERHRIESRFEEEAKDHVNLIQREIELNLQEVGALGAFMAASDRVDRQKFRAFVEPYFLAHRQRAVQALEWIPRVLRDRRGEYEEAARREGFAGFQITERDAGRRMVRAGARPEYFPVYFVEPYQGNEIALGYDLASDPDRLEAVRLAGETGEMQASAPITLVQEVEGQFGLLVFLPVYGQENGGVSTAESHRRLRGFALGVFRAGDILEHAVKQLHPRAIDVHLFDLSASADRQFLAFHASPLRGVSDRPSQPLEALLDSPLHYFSDLEVAGRTWRLVCTPASRFSATKVNWMPWALSGAGLLMTLLVTVFLAALLRRTRQIQRFAAETLLVKDDLERALAGRRKAEEEALASEQRFRRVVETVPDILYTASVPDFVATYISPAIDRLLGFSQEEWLADPESWVRQLYEDDRERVLAAFENALHQGEDLAIEYRLRHKDGRSLRWFEDRASMERDDEGAVVQIYGAMSDITERKRTEEALRESEVRFSDVSHSMADWIWEIDASWKYCFASGRVKDVLGYEPGELLGRTPFELMPEFEEKRLSGVFAGIVADKKPVVDLENWNLSKGGEMVCLLTNGVPIFDEKGELAGYRGVDKDITEHKRMEEALRESEEKFRGITASAHDAIILLDEAGYIVFWNAAAERMFGFPSEEALGKRMKNILAPPERFDVVLKDRDLAEEAGLEVSSGRIFEMKGCGKDECLFPVELSASQLRLRDKQYAVVIVRDITERWQHEVNLRKTRRALSSIHASNVLLMGAQDEQQLVHGICRNIVTEAGFPFVWVGFAEKEKGVLRAVAKAGGEPYFAGPEEISLSGEGVDTEPAAAAFCTGESCIVADVAAGTGAAIWRGMHTDFSVGSVIGLPLLDGDSPFGVLVVCASEPGAFDPEETVLLKVLADDLAYGVKALRTRELHRLAQEKLARQALHDALTGLGNRVMIEESLGPALARARRGNGAVAILFIDLDDFKLVNDTLGHGAGDELLCQVSARLQGTVRESDVVARQGGDEFIVLMEGASADEVRRQSSRGQGPFAVQTSAYAERILSRIKAPFSVMGHETYVSASIGISIFPDDAEDAQTLLQHADSAMYRAKELGKGIVEFYSTELSQRHQKRLLVATLLHQAVERQEFAMLYQPIIDLHSGRMVGVEALIRWQKPEAETVLPADFLPVAEETGLIIPIGEWVVEDVCGQICRWRERGLDLPVSVNFSLRQFWHGDIAQKVLAAISRARVPARLLELEITESTLIQDPARIEAVLRKLRNLGFSISLDDFGTGYSSLGRLRQFPINKLKIDKSFIEGTPQDGNASAIVTAIVQLAQSLGLFALAEGVATGEQWRFLKELGCQLGQGYYFSKPVPPGEIEQLVDRRHKWI
jgi:diguanylate cyclase (GGDEF)-like protein/PAS domain S-box-containing protein